MDIRTILAFAPLLALSLSFYAPNPALVWVLRGLAVVFFIAFLLHARMQKVAGQTFVAGDGEKLAVGDVVRLKSGGPTMTVTRLGHDFLVGGPQVFCTFFEGIRQIRGHFPPDALKKDDATA